MPGSPHSPNESRYDPQVLLNSQPVIVTVIDPADHFRAVPKPDRSGRLRRHGQLPPAMKNCGKDGAVRNSAACLRP